MSRDPKEKREDAGQPGKRSETRVSRRQVLAGGAAGLAGLAASGLGTYAGAQTGGAQRDSRFAGSVVYVTGAARGIGRATALAFAREGADILAFDIGRQLQEVNYDMSTPNDLAETKRLVEQLGSRCVTTQGDTRDFEAQQMAVEMALEELGGLDIAFANAGVTIYNRPLAEVSSQEFQTVMDVNVVGTANTLRAVIPHMSEQGAGRIVATSSTAGRMGLPTASYYAASKWGVIGLVKSAALELAASGVTVNCVTPGPVDTMLANNSAAAAWLLPDTNNPTQEELDSVLEQMSPLGVPWLQPEEVAEVILYLASDAARKITGTALAVSQGGLATNAA